MRCKTLADKLRSCGAEVRFICREHPGHLIQLVRNAGYFTAVLPTSRISSRSIRDISWDDYAAWLGAEQSEDAQQTLEELRNFWPDWLVVDHYGLDATWERLIEPQVGNVLVIDDLANRPHDCDVLLDQNLYTDMERRYSGMVPVHTRQLLSPRFALLRPEFRKERELLRKRDGAVRRILVFFGGVDPTGETGKVLEALQNLNRPQIVIDVVVGGSNPRADDIHTKCSKMPNVTFHRQVSNMAELMAASDFSLGAGGTSQWERCCVGLPTAVTIVAANHSKITRDLVARGVVLGLGFAAEDGSARYCEVLETVFDTADREKLHALQSASLALVDGRGADRVALSMCDEPVQLRQATLEDADKVWLWRNHTRTRTSSINQKAITQAEHLAWWNRSLNNVSRVLLIGSRCGLEVGVLRYDLIREGKAIVSVYLDPDLHRQGLGVALLEAGNKWMLQHCPRVSELQAQILPENERSKRAFEAAGFHFRHGYWIWDTNQTKTKR